MTTSKYIILEESRFISVKGKDNRDFLQGIITNDINKCDNRAIYSCLLTPQGKFLSDFFIIPYNDDLLIEIHEKYFNDFISKLKIYKLRSNIEIKEIDSLKSIIIINKLTEKKINLGHIIINNKHLEYVDPRNENLGNRIILKKELVNEFVSSNNLLLSNINEYKKIMMNNLVPDSLNDLEVSKSLLLENNFDNINAIDWKKGCYIGQELTARMKYRALLKKSLRLVNIDSGVVKSGDNIFFNNINIGKITSVIENKGLALIKIKDANESKKNNIALLTANGKISLMN